MSKLIIHIISRVNAFSNRERWPSLFDENFVLNILVVDSYIHIRIEHCSVHQNYYLDVVMMSDKWESMS